MRSSESGQNLGAGYETSITREEGSLEDGTFTHQNDPGRQAETTGVSSLNGNQRDRTTRNDRPKGRWLRFIGGTLEQLIDDSRDQLLEIQNSIERLQQQETRLRQRLTRYEELKKLAED